MKKFPLSIPQDPGYHNRFGFPYKTTLSFVPYIEWLEAIVKEKSSPDVMILRHVLREVKKIPELLQPIEDLGILDQYRKEVDLLLSTIIPTSVLDELTVGAIVPFQPVTIYATPSFHQMVRDHNKGVWDFSRMNPEHALRDLTAFAGLSILNKHYGMNLKDPEVMKSREIDRLTGAYLYYKPEINLRFVKVKTLKEAKPVGEIDLSPLKQNFFDIEYWLKNFPPDTFEFEGFTIYRMIDISGRELISQLEYMLLESSSAMSQEKMRKIEENLRSYLGVPDMSIGIANMTKYQQVIGCSSDHWFCLIPFEKVNGLMKDSESSIYERVVKTGLPDAVDDLAELTTATAVEKELHSLGFRSFLLAPVYDEKELLGMVEFASPQPYAFNFITMLRLREIQPILSLAFQREIEDFDNRVQAAMKEAFTAIHPVVEWKFKEAAMRMISVKEDQVSTLPLIQFDDVIPIYGAIDIRGSSERRNEAIRLDMIDYLQVAGSILREAFAKYELPILDELGFRAERLLEKLQLTIDSGDENGILDFLNYEVIAAFRIIAERDASLKKSIDNFINSLQPDHEFYHMRRRDFEAALTMINDRVADIIEADEERAQRMLPHYFEKYRTDGVEYNVYVGQSLLEKGMYDPVYLKSFRLWQLTNMVQVARETKRLQAVLPVPLETTQLILCYSNPFSIMFRMDEKRFDVAGAYNIRYEIVKKRIDKARVLGTNERITQPGTIAVIYTQEKEAKEYERYFEFLEAKGYIQSGFERLEVEPLQGMLGLRALRVNVNYSEGVVTKPWEEEELMQHVKSVMA
jgi:hypothetical protein